MSDGISQNRLQDLNDINPNDVEAIPYLFEGCILKMHPTMPIFEGVTFMAKIGTPHKWQLFTCKKRLANPNDPDDYTVIAFGEDYSFPKCVCKRVLEIR